MLELWLGIGQERIQSLWVRIKEKTGRGDIEISVYLLTTWLGRSDEAIYTHIWVTSCLQSLVLIRDVTRAECGLFKDLFRRFPWDEALEGKEVQESCFLFQDHLLQAEEQSITTNRKWGKNSRKSVVDQQIVPGQTQIQEGRKGSKGD